VSLPIRPLQQRAAGLLLWASSAGNISRLLQSRRSAPQQHGAKARRAAANAGGAMFTACI